MNKQLISLALQQNPFSFKRCIEKHVTRYENRLKQKLHVNIIQCQKYYELWKSINTKFDIAIIINNNFDKFLNELSKREESEIIDALLSGELDGFEIDYSETESEDENEENMFQN